MLVVVVAEVDSDRRAEVDSFCRGAVAGASHGLIGAIQGFVL